LPKSILADAVWCDHTDSGDDDASAMVQPALNFWYSATTPPRQVASFSAKLPMWVTQVE
jgi:hypothetical protein